MVRKPAFLRGFLFWPQTAKMRVSPARSGDGAASKNSGPRWHGDRAIFTGLLWREDAPPGDGSAPDAEPLWRKRPVGRGGHRGTRAGRPGIAVSLTATRRRRTSQ